MSMAVDRVFIPAPFLGLLADMPVLAAPAAARLAWLDRTRSTLVAQLAGPHGLSAIPLAEVMRVRADRTRHSLAGGAR